MSSRSSRQNLGQKNRVVLNVETLEDRVTPSTITKTITLGPTLTNFQVQGALPQFDPTLGKLESVTITENGTISSDIQAENTSPVANTITATVSGDFSLSAPGVSGDDLTVTGHPSQNSNPPYPFLAAGNPNDDRSFTGAASVDWADASATSANPNTYTLTDPALLSNYTGTGTVAVTESANANSSATDTTGNITTNIVSNGTATISVTYTYQPTGISGYAYVQTTPNQVFMPGTTPPLAGVTMTLTGGNLTTPLTTTTASDGSYSFTGLAAGTYTVTQTQPTGYLPGTITAGTDNGATDGTVGTENISTITLNAGDSGINYNFGELNQPSISGYVYYEPNAPAQVLYQNNTATPGIAGVTVTLTGSDGSSQTTTTGADGSYSFTPLDPGVTYSIAITHPAGYLVGTDTPGTGGGGTASTTSEEISGVMLTGGVNGADYNFGEIKASSLAGNVYVDSQNAGQIEPGDPPIANDTITLSGFNDQGPVTETTTTAADGTYSFTNLRPGTYGITQTQPAGYLPGATTVGSQGGSETTGDISSISLAAGVNGINNNFGELTPNTPSHPIPKDILPFGILPGISKVQMTTDPSWANVDPTMVSQMAQAVAINITLTGQQLDLNGVAAGVQTLSSSGVYAYVSQVWNGYAHLASEVNGAYETVLNRAPTSAELASGISLLGSGANSTTLLENLYTSQAFQNLYPTSAEQATALYQSILNTTPGSVATQAMVQSLTNGSLSTVVQNLLTSTASLENQIDNAYLLVMRRNPTATETAMWLPQLQSGALTIDQLTQQLLSSQEFSALAYANMV